MSAQPRKPIDWEKIEAEFRAGQLSVREIARQHCLTETAIRKRAKLHKWQRDLSDKVRTAVRNETVRRAVRTELSREPIDDAEIVQTHAERGARANEGFIARVRRLRAIADELTSQLETYMGGGTPTVQIFVSKGDSPATILRSLMDTEERGGKIERQALGIDESPSKDVALVKIEKLSDAQLDILIARLADAAARET